MEVQAELDAVKTAAQRNRLGQFATPNVLAVEIAKYVSELIEAPIRFADPSIGTGSFFSAALKAFGAHRLKSAVGIELDPAFASAARDLWKSKGLDVFEDDFTRFVATEQRLAPPNLILANPPYVRHHHLARDEKERLRALTLRLTGVEVNGLAGLYVHFLLLATAWMAEGGVAAWLIPSEFMDVNYGSALRSFLASRVTLVRVHRFSPDDVQFGDALVSSAVVVFRKAPPPPEHVAEFSFGGSITEPRARDRVSLNSLRAARKWTQYPLHATNDRRTVDNPNGATLGDLFKIQRGIATGCNEFFILERSEAIVRNLPPEFLRPILPSPRHLKDTRIRSDRDGYPVLDKQLCLVDCALAEGVVKSKHPALWQYFQGAEALGIRKGYLVRMRVPWYKQEQRNPAPFLCTYMGRGALDQQPFRFIWNQSAAIGTNLYLMLFPRDVLSQMLREYPNRAEHVHSLLTRVTGHELRGEGRVYGGGLNKIEPRELARVSAAPFLEAWPELRSTIERQGQLFNAALGA